MKRLSFLFDVLWRPTLYFSFIGLIAIGVLFYRLGSLTPGISGDGQVWYQHLTARDFGLKSILNEPFFLPYQLAVYILEKLHVTSIGALRAVSATFGLIAVGSFYYVIRTWYSRRMALLGTALFLSSSWFLHTARIATTDILYLAPLVLLAGGIWLSGNKRLGNLPLVYMALISSVLLYIPGMIWLILICILWQRKRITKGLRRLRSKQLIFAVAGSVILLAPLVRAIIYQPQRLKTLFGLPQQFPNLHDYLHNLALVPYTIFIHGPKDPTRWVGSMPLLDVFMIAMFVIGAYIYFLRIRLDRVKILFGIFIVASLFIALHGPVSFALLLPFVFLVIVAGIGHFLQQWFDIFPRNPFARTLANSLIIIVVAMSCFYNLVHYFVAWPHAPETKQAYTQLRR